MTLKQILGAAAVAAPLALAGPVWAQAAGGAPTGEAPAGMTPEIGGSGATTGTHASGFDTGPGLQPPMAAPGPRTTPCQPNLQAEPSSGVAPNVPPSSAPRGTLPDAQGRTPPAPIPETGDVTGPPRDNAAESAAPATTRGAMPDTTGPNGINPRPQRP